MSKLYKPFLLTVGVLVLVLLMCFARPGAFHAGHMLTVGLLYIIGMALGLISDMAAETGNRS
ncbi:hypothetical protein [Pontibacter vulgaris]|uniref:hypothetical protein n=1 Tax=Pontibacter vulgaris TaxID=2905679 RepID=UPI001FA70986|nr:hypothetical protein [Pontibacter vulgaris]